MANRCIKRVNDSNLKKTDDIAFLKFNSKQIECHLHTRIQSNKCSLLDSSSSHHHPYSSSRYLAMWSHNTESKNRLSNLVWHKTIQTMSNYESLGDWNWMVQVSFCSVFMMLSSWANHEYCPENEDAIMVTDNCDLNYMQCTINPLWQTSTECYCGEKNQRVWKNTQKKMLQSHSAQHEFHNSGIEPQPLLSEVNHIPQLWQLLTIQMPQFR